MRASHLLLRLPLSGGDPLRWFVGVDIHFTSCSGGRGVSTVGLSSSGSVLCAKSIKLFQIWGSPGPAGKLMSQWQSPSVPTVVVNEILNRGADNVVIHITHVSAHVSRTSSCSFRRNWRLHHAPYSNMLKQIKLSFWCHAIAA